MRACNAMAMSGGSVSERRAELRLGIVVERRAIEHRWQKWRFRPVEVLVGAPETKGWRLLIEGEGFARYHAATLPLTLHRTDSEEYLENLTSASPRLFVVLRPTRNDPEPGPQPYRVVLVTASPFEAQGFGGHDDDLVEPVPMPPEVRAFVEGFVARHHVEQPFVKRKRGKAHAESERPGGRFEAPRPMRRRLH